MQRDEIKSRILGILKPYAKAEGLAQATEASVIVQDLGVGSARLVDIVLDV